MALPVISRQSVASCLLTYGRRKRRHRRRHALILQQHRTKTDPAPAPQILRLLSPAICHRRRPINRMQHQKAFIAKSVALALLSVIMRGSAVLRAGAPIEAGVPARNRRSPEIQHPASTRETRWCEKRRPRGRCTENRERSRQHGVMATKVPPPPSGRPHRCRPLPQRTAAEKQH